MKTAISLPEEIFRAADAMAQRMGVSRSALYATAVAEFVAKHRAARVTERLDQVYAVDPTGVAPAVRLAQQRSVERPEW